MTSRSLEVSNSGVCGSKHRHKTLTKDFNSVSVNSIFTDIKLTPSKRPTSIATKQTQCLCPFLCPPVIVRLVCHFCTSTRVVDDEQAGLSIFLYHMAHTAVYFLSALTVHNI